MKKVLNFVAPLVVVAIIFVVVMLLKDNYDPRNLEKQKAETTIKEKHIKPAGTTYQPVGNGRSIPVTNQEEPTFVFLIEGKEVSGVVDMELYKKKKVGDAVIVEYLNPKYAGDPIVVSTSNDNPK